MSGVTITAIRNAARAEFNSLMAEYNDRTYGLYSKIVQVIPSTAAAELYDWYDSVKRMRKFQGQSRPIGLGKNEYSLINQPWETTIAVDAQRIDDDVSNILDSKIGSLVAQASRNPWMVADDFFANGLVGIAWDGTEFFSDTRENDNIVTGTGITLETIKADINTAYARMITSVNNAGAVQGHTPAWILADGFLVATIAEILGAMSAQGEGYNSGSKNYHASWFQGVIASPRLTGSKDYILISGDDYPVIWQDRQKPDLRVKDESVGANRYLYQAYSRGACDYKLPETAIIVTNT